MTLGKGTRKELKLAVRAIRAARTHLKNARCGTRGPADEHALALLILMGHHVNDLLAMIGVLPHRAVRKFKRGAA